MIRSLMLLKLTLVMMVFSTSLNAQIAKKIELNPVEKSFSEISGFGIPQINAKSFRIYQMDISSLVSQMVGTSRIDKQNSGFVASIRFPHPDGTFHDYLSQENNTMDSTLASNFPEIKSYDAYGTEDNSFVKWDITQHGFHAMIMIPGQSTIFIDPLIKGNTNYYIVYRRDDFMSDKTMQCGVLGDTSVLTKPNNNTLKIYGTCELRTYRLALAATGEYTAFYGGTVSGALAGQVTTMNRVNGVYEREMAIRMTIIANNNLIIYTNSATDPYTNNNGGTMLGQNQTNINNVIGLSNYDIGHVFSTGGGGIAQLYSPCTSNKAKGVTGSGSPIGDPFDIDYVAHEMGHQFGANHTFNNNSSGSCSGNANTGTSYEPGSGTTIMAYAGICTATFNVQNNSNDYFQTISLQEIGAFITSAGHTCPVKTALSNNSPTANPVAAVTVPQGTPFFLTATATDPNANTLTYCWEEMDAGIATTQPTATQTTKANFRSYNPTTNPTRYFPNLSSLASNGPFTWEVLPTVARTLNFRVTVRDNATGGGCNDSQNTTVAISTTSGPFVVTYPNATGITWAGVSSQTVTWNVAGTTGAPVSCANVDILLSTDGGLTYPTILATNVPNSGSQVVTVPNTASTTCRIMVRCNNFFDISNNNFTITAATNDYTMSTSLSSVSICQGSNATYTVSIGKIGTFSNPVTLSVSGVPAGATSNFSVNSVTPIGTSVLTISNTAGVTPGSYTITITGNSTTGTKINTVILIVSSGSPSAVTQTSPANGATGVAIPTAFNWTTAPEVGVTYAINIASDNLFATIVDQATGLTATTYISSALLQNTTYYWRVRSSTGCGTSSWSATRSFTTSNCSTYAATGLPIAISASGTPTITSTINVPTGGSINDVNIFNLVGQHTYVSDLTVSLTSPLGTTVTLFSGICTTLDNFNLNFNDAAPAGAIPCPPTTGGTFQPVNPLSAFNGENAAGNWVLTISDGFNLDGGSLDSWSLQLCVNPCVAPSTPGTITGSASVCSGSTGNVYSIVAVSGATSYTWTVPSGATISSGQGTISATVTFGSTSGNVSVTATNACGTSSASNLAITVNAIPSTPVVTVTNNCGSSLLTASGTGTVLWSTGATTASITVSTGGTYTVTRTVSGCTSLAGSGVAAPLAVPSTPVVTVTNNCGSSTLTASGSGTFLWSTGATTSSITVSTGGTYTVTQTVGGCTSASGSGVASPLAIPSTPVVTVSNNCGSSTLSASGTGTFIWSTGATTSSITVSTGGTYTVTRTVSGCTSAAGSGVAAPLAVPSTPVVTVTNNCGSSTLSASGTGTFLWSTGATTSSITVSTGGTYTVTQTVGGCTSAAGSGVAAPLAVPSTPVVTVTNNCGSSLLSASGTGTFLWSTGATTTSITVSTGGTYTVTRTVSGCTSLAGSGVSAPLAVPSTPVVTVSNNCGSSTLSASGTGTFLWSTGATTSSITVSAGGTYTVTQTVGGCTSAAGSGVAAPMAVPSIALGATVNPTVCGATDGSITINGSGTGNLSWSGAITGNATGITLPYTITGVSAGAYSIIFNNTCPSNSLSASLSDPSAPSAPVVTVTNNCGSSTLSTSGTGTFLWSTGATTASITVSTGGTYTVTQTVGGCTSAAGSGVAAPLAIPSTPVVTVSNNCGSSILTASGTGSFLWSTGATTSSITVSTSGTYTVTQTVGSCTSSSGSGVAAPLASPTITLGATVNPTVCGASDGSITINGSGTGNLSWSGAITGNATGITLPYTITGVSAGAYSINFNNACPSNTLSASLTDPSAPSAPVVTVTNNCGSSTLSTSGTGTFLWSTGATTASITVSTGGTYTVTQTVGGCTSSTGSGVAAPMAIPSAPVVTVINNCGSSTLAASGTGTFLWSTGATTSSITVSTSGTYTVTETVGACTSSSGSGVAAPSSAPSAPIVTVSNNCGSSALTASGTGAFLWSTGATTASITVSTGGTYTVTETVGGCTSSAGSGVAAPSSAPSAPLVSVTDNCGSSTLTTSGTGSFLWSTGETTPSITVTAGGSYTVTQTVGGCTSSAGSGVAAPLSIPSPPVITVLDKCGMSDLSTSATGSLMWSTSESSSTISVTSAGTYYVSQTVGSCTSAVGTGVAAPLTISNVTVAPFADVCINTAPFTLSGGTPSGGTYTGTGVTSNMFDPSVAGYGTFTITYTYTSGNGCVSSNQQPITVGCAGIEEKVVNTIIVYPNPSNGLFAITSTGEIITTVSIYDETGRLVQLLGNVSQTKEMYIDLSEFANGIYSLEINANENIYRNRVILNK